MKNFNVIQMVLDSYMLQVDNDGSLNIHISFVFVNPELCISCMILLSIYTKTCFSDEQFAI